MDPAAWVTRPAVFRRLCQPLILATAICCSPDTAAVVIVPDDPPENPGNPPGDDTGPAYPNRPSNMTEIARSNGMVEEAAGSAMGIGDFGRWYTDPAAPPNHIDVVADATNPAGTGAALRFTWSEAYTPRSGTTTAEHFSGGPYRELYIMIRIFLEEDWPRTGNKYFYIGAADGARHNVGSPTQFWTSRENDGSLMFVNQNIESEILVNSSATDATGNGTQPLVRGKWLNIEYHLVSQSSSDAADGVVRVWVNNVLTGTNRTVRWVLPGDPLGFSGMEWYATNNSIPSVGHYRLGELYIAGMR